MNNSETSRWLAEYLDDFDIHCQKTPCEKCPIHQIREENKDKSCFRIYCELREKGTKID